MPEPEEILILNKEAKKHFQDAIETTLTNVIGTMQTFLFELKKIDDPDYNQKFYDELLSLAEEAHKIQEKLNKDEHVTLTEFTAFTNNLTHANEQLKNHKFESKKAEMLARMGKQVFPQGANQEYKQMEPIHQAIQESMQKVIKQVEQAAQIISEHHSLPKQATALQAFFKACSALAQTWKGKLDKAFTFSPKEKEEKASMFEGFKKIGRSSFESLHNTVKDTAHQTQEQAKSLKRKASSLSSENKESEAEPTGKRPTLVTGFKEELQKKYQEMQAKRAEKENRKPPTPSP